MPDTTLFRETTLFAKLDDDKKAVILAITQGSYTVDGISKAMRRSGSRASSSGAARLSVSLAAV